MKVEVTVHREHIRFTHETKGKVKKRSTAVNFTEETTIDELVLYRKAHISMSQSLGLYEPEEDEQAENEDEKKEEEEED